MRALLEGNRVSRISVRGFAVASATAVTTVGAVVGVASGAPQSTSNDVEATAADTTLLADIPAGQQAQVQTASLTQQADAQSAQASAAAKKSAEESARLQAAKDAKSKKESAEEKAKEREREKEQVASRSETRDPSSFPQQSSYTVEQVKAIARQIVPADQFQCFSNIVNHESTWNYLAVNSGSGAYGLVQALPGSKMSSVGSDWRTNPATQIKWGLNYMNSTYHSPCGAWTFWQANTWY